jgi:GNAT superfamily N-acetyltransferase
MCVPRATEAIANTRAVFAVFRLLDRFRPSLRRHFSRLEPEDVYSRFGTYSHPEVIDQYVAGIHFEESIVMGVMSHDGELVGAAHLGPIEEGWDLGLSVLAPWRNQGIGTLLLRKSMELAESSHRKRLFVHSLAGNHAMRHLARKIKSEHIAQLAKYSEISTSSFPISVPDDVKDFSVGDEVYSVVRFPSGLAGVSRAYAEYVSAPASEGALKPTGIDHVHAAGAPMSPLTAWQFMTELGHNEPNPLQPNKHKPVPLEVKSVLVNGAAGGVGHFAVQIS